MIVGVVTVNREAVIRLETQGAEGLNQPIEAIIDTGFDGALTLPPELISELRLQWSRKGRALLANGSDCEFDIYDGIVLWDGKRRRVAVDEANTAPLVGMTLLHGYELNLHVRNGGTVTIQALPASRGVSGTRTAK